MIWMTRRFERRANGQNPDVQLNQGVVTVKKITSFQIISITWESMAPETNRKSARLTKIPREKKRLSLW